MGRKNSSARRKSQRLNRRQKGEGRPPSVRVPRPSVENLVMPDGLCHFRLPAGRRPKMIFATEEKAARALRAAQADRARTGSGRVEKRYYRCPPGGCGGFHLTAREEYDQSTADFRHRQFEERTKNARQAEIEEAS